MEENIIKIFNNAELPAIKNINGQVKEIMELSKIKLEYQEDYNNGIFKAMGTREIQPAKSNIYLIGNAEVNYISKECYDIATKTYGNLNFKLTKKNNQNTIVLNCYLEDAENLTIGNNIEFQIHSVEKI